MIGWTKEKLDRLVKCIRESWTPSKDGGFFENLYCIEPGDHETFTDLQLIDAGFDMTRNPRKIISQKLAYHGPEE